MASAAAPRITSGVAVVREAPAAPSPSAAPCADCRYFGSLLPRGRAVSFCPYCGQDLTVRQCPACSAELDLGWRFCVCCGRSMGEG